MDIAYIHFYVENITQTSNWFKEKIGLTFLGKWVKDSTVTELLGNNSVLFYISAPLNSLSPTADYLKIHPPGIADIAFYVKDILAFLNQTKRLGVEIIQAYSSNEKVLYGLKIQAWGSLSHTIIQKAYSERLVNNFVKPQLMITGIDHLVLNVPSHQFDTAVSWYQNLFNWKIQQTFDIKSQRSSLYSVALVDSQTKIQFNLNKPTSANSQIQEFLDINNGAGIQHIALQSSNIFETVNQMRKRGLDFLSIPKAYYTQLLDRYHGIVPTLKKEEWQLLEKQQILLDWTKDNPESMLMQIFSQPIFNQPTFFLEIIERRRQVQGFGEANFQSLFEAIEKDLIVRRKRK